MITTKTDYRIDLGATGHSQHTKKCTDLNTFLISLCGVFQSYHRMIVGKALGDCLQCTSSIIGPIL